MTAPAPKKRKRDHNEEVRAPAAKKPTTTSNQQSQALVPANSWDSRSAAATDDVCTFVFDACF
jgi:dual-specificity kinase